MTDVKKTITKEQFQRLIDIKMLIEQLQIVSGSVYDEAESIVYNDEGKHDFLFDLFHNSTMFDLEDSLLDIVNVEE